MLNNVFGFQITFEGLLVAWQTHQVQVRLAPVEDFFVPASVDPIGDGDAAFVDTIGDIDTATTSVDPIGEDDTATNSPVA